jgi:hypothetical protein
MFPASFQVGTVIAGTMASDLMVTFRGQLTRKTKLLAVFTGHEKVLVRHK